MSTKLGGLAQLLDPGLVLGGVPPFEDREYRVPLPSSEVGLWIRATVSAGAGVYLADTEAQIAQAAEKLAELPEMGDGNLSQLVLGAVYDAMVADGVSHPHVEFCTNTAVLWIVGGCGPEGERLAAEYWHSGGNPEALARGNRANRRAAVKAAGKTPTAAVTATRPRASTSGTKSRPASAAPAKVTKSRGSASSKPGQS